MSFLGCRRESSKFSSITEVDRIRPSATTLTPAYVSGSAEEAVSSLERGREAAGTSCRQKELDIRKGTFYDTHAKRSYPSLMARGIICIMQSHRRSPRSPGGVRREENPEHSAEGAEHC